MKTKTYEKTVNLFKIVESKLFPNNPVNGFRKPLEGEENNHGLAAFIWEGDKHYYLINPLKVYHEHKTGLSLMSATHNPQVDFRNFGNEIILPCAFGDFLLAGIVAHECRHRFQRIQNVRAIISSQEYKNTGSFFYHLLQCVLSDIKQGYYTEDNFEEEIDAAIIQHIFMREVYMRVFAYEENISCAISNCSKIISYNLEQLTELVNSYCWVNIKNKEV